MYVTPSVLDAAAAGVSGSALSEGVVLVFTSASSAAAAVVAM